MCLWVHHFHLLCVSRCLFVKSRDDCQEILPHKHILALRWAGLGAQVRCAADTEVRESCRPKVFVQGKAESTGTPSAWGSGLRAPAGTRLGDVQGLGLKFTSHICSCQLAGVGKGAVQPTHEDGRSARPPSGPQVPPPDSAGPVAEGTRLERMQRGAAEP